MTDIKKKKSPSAVKNSDLKPRNSKTMKTNGLELLIITRETYRAPVDTSAPVQVQIGKERFDAVNLSKHGIGFIVSDLDVFRLDDILDPMTVIWGKTRIRLKGRVVHVSPNGAGKYLCGIEIVHTEPEPLERFEALLERNRLMLFSHHHEDAE